MNLDISGAKVLVVDDNPANIDILLELLSDYDVRAALDGSSALEAVKEELPDLILLDITMPGMDGFEVCRRLKSVSRTKDIPVIFLSASNDDASILKGFEIGGVDYITKPYRAKEVLARVRTHLQLYTAIRQLETIATTDALTGISNRRRFFMRAEGIIRQAKERNIPLFLAIIDLDGFKPINDTHGHDVGDAVIKGFSNAALEILPPNSCFARLGGDEFVTILSGNKEGVIKRIEMLRSLITKLRVKSHDVHVTASIGVSMLSHPDDSITSLLKRADNALYTAKGKGGNTVTSNFE